MDRVKCPKYWHQLYPTHVINLKESIGSQGAKWSQNITYWTWVCQDLHSKSKSTWPTIFLSLRREDLDENKSGCECFSLLHSGLYLIEQVPGLIVLLGAATAEDRFVVHFYQLPFRTEAEVAKNSK